MPGSGVCKAVSAAQPSSRLEAMPPDEVVGEIDQRVDMETLERVLMEEAIRKFTDPQKALVALVARRRAAS